MLKEFTNSLITNSIVELGEVIDDTQGKGRSFVSRFIEAGVAHYREFGDVLITKETLDKFIHTMVGCPVIINHKDITEKNADKERVGVVCEVWFEPMDGWYYCKGIIWDKQAIDLVKNQGWNVSCTYDFESDFIEKTHNGKKIDMEFTNGKFLHLALVNNPRYERANIVVNSREQVENEDKWITIHPNGEDEKGKPLLIKDGETFKEAMQRQFGAYDDQLTLDFKGAKEINKQKRIEENKKQMAKDKLYKAILEDKKKDTNESLKKLGEAEDEYLKYFDDFETYDGFVEDYEKEQEKNKADLAYKEMIKKQAEKAETKTEDKKETKKEETKHPFGDDVEHRHSDTGFMYSTKGTNYYTKGNKDVEVEEYGDKGGIYRVKLKENGRTKDIKEYSTKKGMEKKVTEFLSGGENKETKALSEKTNLEEKEKSYKDVLQKYNEADKKRWGRDISREEYHKAWDDYEKYKKELTKARREYAESIMSNFEEQDNTAYTDKQNARRERYENLADKNAKLSEQAHQRSRDMVSVIPMGQPIHGDRDRRYREKAWDKLGQGVKLGEKSDYYKSKASSVGKAGISADDANAIAKLAQKYKSGVDSAEKRRIIDRVIDIHSRKNSNKPATETSEHGFEITRNQDNNRLQLKFDGKPDANTRSILKSNGFRWSPSEGAWQRQLTGNAEYSLKRVQEQLKKVNNSVNNIVKGNLFMSVFEDLENFVMGIVENACDKKEKFEEEETIVENEDKRKIIDEVGGILKDKVDEEVWRTVIGKLEKIAYEPSEETKADNKCKNEDEEDEEEYEEMKEIAEDAEDKKGKKEEKEEEKKEEKKEVKNSMDDVAKMVYGQAETVKSYTTTAERLELGNNY